MNRRPSPRANWLNGRTIIYSLIVGAAVASLAGGSVTLGMIAWVIVYVLAALSPDNRTTCPECGTPVRPQANRCSGCGIDLVNGEVW